jgi:tetratricopeptide (TPR) repeat protein
MQIPAMASPNATIIVQANPTFVASYTPGLVCPKCHFQNRPGAKFCKRDGQPLTQGAVVAPPQQARARIQARPAQQPLPARPAQSIQARPVQSIQARPVSTGTTIATSNAAATAPASTVVDGNAAYRTGLQLLVNKKYAEAVNQFKLARRAGGPEYDVLYNLGRAYRQYGQSVKELNKKLFTDNMKYAAEQFEEAIRCKKDAFDAHFQLGMCYRDLGLSAQAMSTFEKALALAPQDPAIYYQLGMAASEQGLKRKAEEYFQNGLRIHPEHTLILIALGRLYIETRQIPNAISTLRQATKHDDTLWEGWYELGKAHMRAKEWNFALSALERARQIGTHVPEIYNSMVMCYLKVNKKAEARQMINEALQRDPTNAEALRLQKQL